MVGPSSAVAAVVDDTFICGRGAATTVSETSFFDSEAATDLASLRNRDAASTTVKAPFFSIGASTTDETSTRGKDAVKTVSELPSPPSILGRRRTWLPGTTTPESRRRALQSAVSDTCGPWGSFFVSPSVVSFRTFYSRRRLRATRLAPFLNSGRSLSSRGGRCGDFVWGISQPTTSTNHGLVPCGSHELCDMLLWTVRPKGSLFCFDSYEMCYALWTVQVFSHAVL